MSTFWSWWVIILFVGTVIGVCWVLIANRKVVLRDDQEVEDGTPKTGHVYDGIEEFDNPLPAWWFKMFIGSVVFSFVYVVLYPGLGSFPGLLGWTSIGQWQQQEARADERFEAVYAKFEGQSIEELAANPAAFKIGRRLFGNNCAVCHGSDGGGAYGFPDLTDDDWLYGNTPQAIEASIRHGRRGVMPGWGAALGETGVSEVTEYLFKLGGRDHDEALATAGEQKFAGFCAGCHGADASGNVALGAPDLSDNIWLYGGSPEMIKTSIRSGRQGNMPAQDKMLRTSKIRLLTSYVYGLSER